MKTNGLLSILLFLVTSIATAKTVVLSPDVPLQKQMTQPNVTYVLSSRHDLGGKTLALPANCKLSVTNDGCICNGKVTGTLKNKQVDIRWFGASASDAKYNAEAIENAARVCSQVVIPSETYVLSRSVRLQAQNLTLRGEGTSSQLKVLSPMRVLDVLPQSVGLMVKGISFQGVGSKKEGSYLIYVGNNAARIKVLDCVFDGGTGGVLFDYECKYVEVTDCTFRNMVYIPGAGMAAGGNHAAGGAGSYGVVFQQRHDSSSMPGGRDGITYGKISGCLFESTIVRHAIYVQSSHHIQIVKNTIYGTPEMNDSQLMSDLLQTGLSDAQIRQMDERKHMTIADGSLNFRGSDDVLIKNNKVYSGIGFIRGTTDRLGKKGRGFVVKGNYIEHVKMPKTGMKVIDTSFADGVTLSNNVIVP